MADFDRTELARLGAQARIQELETEMAAIRSAFPGLGAIRGRKPGRPAKAAGSPRRRHRSKMSAAARKAVSARMKKYWAARRKAKGTAAA